MRSKSTKEDAMRLLERNAKLLWYSGPSPHPAQVAIYLRYLYTHSRVLYGSFTATTSSKAHSSGPSPDPVPRLFSAYHQVMLSAKSTGGVRLRNLRTLLRARDSSQLCLSSYALSCGLALVMTSDALWWFELLNMARIRVWSHD